MFQSLKMDCGSQIIHQSHKNRISGQSLEMHTMMANNQDILGQYSFQSRNIDSKIEDTYRMGIKNLRKTICNLDHDLKKFKNHLNIHYSEDPGVGDQELGAETEGINPENEDETNGYQVEL